MLLVSGLVVLAGVTIDIVAVLQFLRGRKETSLVRIRAIGERTRVLAAVALFTPFIVPVAGVFFALQTADSIDPERRAIVLAQRISGAMSAGSLGTIFAVPSVTIAVWFARTSRLLRREDAAKQR